MSEREFFDVPLMSELSFSEKKKVLIKKLGQELKVFSDSVLVIDMETYNKENNPVGYQVDILVQTKNNVKDVRDYLNGEVGIKIINEGPSFLITKDDTAFQIKITT